MIETQYNLTLKVIRSDNGLEFFHSYFYASKDIHQKSCVETPQKNACIERKHQRILNVGWALLFQSKLPMTFGLMLLLMQFS